MDAFRVRKLTSKVYFSKISFIIAHSKSKIERKQGKLVRRNKKFTLWLTAGVQGRSLAVSDET